MQDKENEFTRVQERTPLERDVFESGVEQGSLVSFSRKMLTDEEIENESQHVTYIDELLWLLEDARRVAYGEAGLSVLKGVINEMSDGIPEWLESLKRKPPHIEVWSEGELLISSGMEG